ncbi:MAG: putative prokaryotic signal transducing protein [Planctomycetota bacterium]
MSDDADPGLLPTVHLARDEFEAECVRGVLEDAGIASVVPPTGQGVFGFPLRAGGPGVPVRVLPQDLSRAREVLADARWRGRSIDWDEVEVGDMPPEVARLMRPGGRPRWIRRVAIGVALTLLALMLASVVSGAWRAIVPR